MRKALLNTILILLFSGTVQAQSLWNPWYITPRATPAQHLDLNGKWKLSFRDKQISDLKELDKLEFFETNIPSSVHWSLYNAGKLPHPYYNKNSDKYKWVDEKVWYYTKTFSGPSKGDNFVFLCFDGLDYFSKVWINGTLLGVHEGMFGGPSVEVSRYIREGQENKITVELRAGNWGNKAEDFDSLPRTPTGDRDFTGRKGFNSRATGRIIKPWVISGGSAAEMFFSIGMWKPVRIELVPKVGLERPYLTTTRVQDNKAFLRFSAEVFANSDQLKEKLHPTHNTGIRHPRDKGYPFIPLRDKMSLRLEFKSAKGSFTKEVPLTIYEGRNWVDENIIIDNPAIWNPVGLGSPDLYTVSCTLKRNDSAVDKIDFDFGIRTIERVPSAGPRLADNWENWQFIVNGNAIFVKGMNFTPQDVLLETNEQKYRWTLTAAKNMGVQLIRVWGGGLIETDPFYKICNELGLMVWQDFPIGNQNTPDYPQDVWEAQVVQNICRLRNNPSLVVWCGGNEFNPYSAGNTATIGILERNLKIFDSGRLFVRASPDGGSVHMYPDIDPSYYNIFYKYEPFVSETGMHSVPEPALLYELVDNKELKDPGKMWEPDFAKTHPDFVHHFGEYGAARVPRMLSRASHISDMSNPSIEVLSEATQIGAAEFYQILSDKMQINYPVTTGIMPWVFKRQWPIIAIQFMDWFGHANAPYYFLKRTYEPLHVAIDLPRLLWAPGESIDLNAKVLKLPTFSALEGSKLMVSVYDDTFKLMAQKEGKPSDSSQESVSSVNLGAFKIPEDYKDRFLFVLAELRSPQGKVLSRSLYYPRSLAKMQDPSFFNSYVNEALPWITFEKGPWLKPVVEKSRATINVSGLKIRKAAATGESKISVSVRNTGAVPAFMTTLDVTGVKRAAVASDNFFWLAPGEVKKIEIDVLWREDSSNALLQVKAWNASPVLMKL